MIRTDTAHSDINDDEDFQASNDDHPHEHISCPSHPDYKLQLLCTKENFTPLLLCIKCLIDSDIQRKVSGEDLVYIHDAINKGLSTDVSESQMQAAKAKLEQKFIEFSSVDYLGVYEQHSNAQINRLDREITRIKESLDELQSQFKQLFSRQYKYLKNKQDELTAKIKGFIDEQEHIDTLRGLNTEEITEAIRKLTDAKEYEKLVKALFDRGNLNEGVTEGTMLKDIFGIIDDLKGKVHNLKNFKIEMTRLEDIRHRIESIEMLDYSLQAFPPSLNSSLLQTLDKIRNAEKKKNFLSSQKDVYASSEKLHKAANFEKIGGYSQIRNGHQMQVEFSPRNEYNVKKERYSSQKGSPKGRDYDRMMTEENERRQARHKKVDGNGSILKGTNSGIQPHKLHSIGTNMSLEARYHRKGDEGSFYKRQKVDEASYRGGRSSRSRHHEKEEEDSEEQEENEDDDYGQEEIYMDDNSREVKDEDDESNLNESSKKSQRSRLQKLSAAKPSKVKASQSTSKRDVKQENQMSAMKRTGSQNNKASLNKSSEKWKKAEHKGKQREQDQRRKKRAGRKKRDEEDDDSDEAYIASENDDEEDEDEEYEEESDSAAPKRKKTDRGVHGLHDWINRRVTGYLIFQNTMQDEKLEKGRDGDHLNRVTGKKWKKLSKSEKEEYKSLAMNARVELKKEFKDIDKDSPELSEFQEMVEKKMKKIKKE